MSTAVVNQSFNRRDSAKSSEKSEYNSVKSIKNDSDYDEPMSGVRLGVPGMEIIDSKQFDKLNDFEFETIKMKSTPYTTQIPSTNNSPVKKKLKLKSKSNEENEGKSTSKKFLAASNDSLTNTMKTFLNKEASSVYSFEKTNIESHEEKTRGGCCTNSSCILF